MRLNIFKGSHHRRHHRHKKFHVRPEAKGAGYRKFLGVPCSRTFKPAEPEPEAMPEEGEKDDQESREVLKPRQFRRYLVVVMGLILLMAFWNTMKHVAWLEHGMK